MMDRIAIQALIDSGSLEQYCFEQAKAEPGNELAQLRGEYPEIHTELQEIELAIEQLAFNYAVRPRASLKNRIMAALDFAEDVIDLEQLPPTGKYSNHNSWLKAVEPLIRAEQFENFFVHVLQQNDRLAQTLVVTKLDVPEEIHEVVAESFFILKGTCVCTVGKEVFTLNAGDHLVIPLHTTHDIRIVSPYVVAILQHQFA